MTDVHDPRISYRDATGWIDALTGVHTPVAFPTAETVGVAGIPGWEPTFTVTDDNYSVMEEGAVIEDVRVVNGAFLVRAPNVTVRRCELINGSFVNDYSGPICNGALFEDCTVRMDPPGGPAPVNATWTAAGYTCNRCSLIECSEGWHTGASMSPLLDPSHPDGHTVRLYNCYAQIQSPPDCVALGIDWHGDVVQAFDASQGGVPLVIRNCSFHSIDAEDCGASAIIGIGFGQSMPVDFDGIIMSGAGVTMHADSGGSYRNLYFVDGSWDFTPVSIEPDYWPLVTDWERIVTCTLDVNGQPDELIASIPFNYPGFGPLDPPPES